jgi:hypothetical protein
MKSGWLSWAESRMRAEPDLPRVLAAGVVVGAIAERATRTARRMHPWFVAAGTGRYSKVKRFAAAPTTAAKPYIASSLLLGIESGNLAGHIGAHGADKRFGRRP